MKGTRLLLGIVALVLLLPGASATALQRASDVPPQLNDGLQTASPESVGLDGEKIEALLQSIRSGSHPNLRSVLVIKDGALVLEEYAGGSHSQRKHDVASVTKSVTSILIGIAIDQGTIAGPDQPLAELLPDYADLIHADPAKRDLKLWHILTMTSGFEWDEESHPYGHAENDATRMQRETDPVRFVLERPIVHEPGSHFQYAGANSMLLSAILKRQTGTQAHAYAKEHLFKPLGIAGARWGLYANALTDTDGGLSLRSRDMAKIGLLYLSSGRWSGEQVVSERWVEESTRAHVGATAGSEYGYQWWRTGVPVGLRSIDTYFASGFGGQAINVFPDLNMVVVFTNDWTPGSGNAMRNLAMMSEYLLPAALPNDVSSLLMWVWPVLIGLSLIALLWDLGRSRSLPPVDWLSWTWIVLIFGPLGFAAYWVSGRKTQGATSDWRRALAAMLDCTGGNAAGFCLLFALIALFAPEGNLLPLTLVFPLLVGWVVFRAPIFAQRTRAGYFLSLRRTLLAEIITTLLVLAGMLPLIVMLQTRWFPIGNFDLSNPLFWLMMSTAAVAGAIVVFPFNYWLAHRGRLFWPGPVARAGEPVPTMLTLRHGWWALLLSPVVLAASLAFTFTTLA